MAEAWYGVRLVAPAWHCLQSIGTDTSSRLPWRKPPFGQASLSTVPASDTPFSACAHAAGHHQVAVKELRDPGGGNDDRLARVGLLYT